MRVNQVNITNRSLNFTSGKTILFTDFDGTFLPQPLYDMYNGTPAAKAAEISNLNKYFSEFQNFINRQNGNFDIVISTGRRLDWHKQKGFIPFYEELKKFGVKFPKIKQLITSGGGDVYDFMSDGRINSEPNRAKSAIMEKLSGWNFKKIKAALDTAANETDTRYSLVNPKGSYSLSIRLQNEDKIESFLKKLTEILNKDVKFRAQRAEVKNYNYDLSCTVSPGIKLEPIVWRHHLSKDFDVREALKFAMKNDDFVIAAGDAPNDKHMLNIFKYLKDRHHIPKCAEDVTPQYVASVKDEIDKLPVKLLFIKPKPDDTKKLPLYEFMKKLEECFPQKVQIVEQTYPGSKNNFLDAIENAINSHKFLETPKKNKLWGYLILGVAAVLGIGYAVKRFVSDKKNLNEQKQLPEAFQIFAR